MYSEGASCTTLYYNLFACNAPTQLLVPTFEDIMCCIVRQMGSESVIYAMIWKPQSDIENDSKIRCWVRRSVKLKHNTASGTGKVHPSCLNWVAWRTYPISMSLQYTSQLQSLGKPLCAHLHTIIGVNNMSRHQICSRQEDGRLERMLASDVAPGTFYRHGVPSCSDIALRLTRTTTCDVRCGDLRWL